MRQLLSCVLSCALCVTCVRADDAKPAPAAAGQGKWADVKGQVVFPEKKDIPKREKLDITQDKDHCTKDGDILDESVIVNAKNRGVKNVIVWLRPAGKNPKAAFGANEIHPADAKRKPGEVVIDQPCCMFVARVTCARVGDILVVKNSAPVPHNFFWSTANNGEFNVTIPKMDKWVMKDANAPQPRKLVAEAGTITYKCTIHGWMTGHVRIFDHPYFAVTDADGKFEIKNAPVGQYSIVFWHENVGLRGGPNGRFGEPINIAGPVMVMKPTDFDVTEKR